MTNFEGLDLTIRQDNSHWRSRDLNVVWHPCTQMQDHETLPMIPIERGRGVWLHDFDGNKYIDAVSSWWVNLFGHANPEINAAISQQMDTLEHVMLAGFSHQAVIELSERLVDITRKRKPGRPVVLVRKLAELADNLVSMSRPGDVIITLGAGSITRVSVELATRLDTLSAS